jgi:hypothetical protein
MMVRIVKIKIGDVVYEIPENAVANYPHLLRALQQQGSSEKPQITIQTPSSGMETGEPEGSVGVSEQISPRRTQRRGI